MVWRAGYFCVPTPGVMGEWQAGRIRSGYGRRGVRRRSRYFASVGAADSGGLLRLPGGEDAFPSEGAGRFDGSGHGLADPEVARNNGATSLQVRGVADPCLQRHGQQVVLTPVLEDHVERPGGPDGGVAQARGEGRQAGALLPGCLDG